MALQDPALLVKPKILSILENTLILCDVTTIYLQTKKYMGEWRFLFFTMAVMTRMFSSREMIPRIRKT